ncbi:MAG: hypothetical protein MJZ66_03100 [Bacteroidales bacterium]|nr:hypothetical protein [Bacteroidales bacterium]
MGYALLRRKARELSRNKTFNNLETSVSVAILFDYDQQGSVSLVRSFASELESKGKNVSLLGITSGVGGGDDAVIKLVSLQKLTFLCYPDNEAVIDPFLKKDFDILINLCGKDCLVLDYILGLSKARFKVSPQLENDAFADFILRFSNPGPQDAAVILKKVREYLAGMQKA